MISNEEWSTISGKAFPRGAAAAPPFLWTRVLAGIQAEELRRASVWWMQWKWMSELTIAAVLVLGLGTFYLVQQAAAPLEAALEGRSSQQQAIQLADAGGGDTEASDALVPEFDS